MSDLDHRRNLIRAYKGAGEDFLALRLERVFRRIETDEDKILHNDIMAEISIIIGDSPQRGRMLLAEIARILLDKEPPKKTFLRQVADKILNIGQKE